MRKLLVVFFALALAFVLASPILAHPGPKNHPLMCKHYKGHPVKRRACIAKCLHPHKRRKLRQKACVEKFKRNNPIKK